MTSPFNKPEFSPIGVYTKRGLQKALKLPNGNVIVNFNDSVHDSLINELAKALNGEIVVVKGTWVFTPDEHQTPRVSAYCLNHPNRLAATCFCLED